MLPAVLSHPSQTLIQLLTFLRHLPRMKIKNRLAHADSE